MVNSNNILINKKKPELKLNKEAYSKAMFSQYIDIEKFQRHSFLNAPLEAIKNTLIQDLKNGWSDEFILKEINRRGLLEFFRELEKAKGESKDLGIQLEKETKKRKRFEKDASCHLEALKLAGKWREKRENELWEYIEYLEEENKEKEQLEYKLYLANKELPALPKQQGKLKAFKKKLVNKINKVFHSKEQKQEIVAQIEVKK